MAPLVCNILQRMDSMSYNSALLGVQSFFPGKVSRWLA